MQSHLNSWMGQVFGFLNTLLRIKNHWISLQILIERPLPSAVRAWLSTVAAPRTSHPTHTSITSPLSFPLLLYYCILSLSLLHPTHTFITFLEHSTNFLLHSHYQLSSTLPFRRTLCSLWTWWAGWPLAKSGLEAVVDALHCWKRWTFRTRLWLM